MENYFFFSISVRRVSHQMVGMRSPPALKFSATKPYVVQNVLLETLSGAAIAHPSKILDANFVYPESLLRLVREAKLDSSSVFWFTLVLVGRDDVERQFVLQATAAQVEPRTNATRDGGIGLASWVFKTMYPQTEDKRPETAKAPEEVPVVTGETFANMVQSVNLDTFTQPGGPTRAQFADDVSELEKKYDKMGKNPRGNGKRHRAVPLPNGYDGTPAARRPSSAVSESPSNAKSQSMTPAA